METLILDKTQLIVKPIMLSLHKIREELECLEEELSLLSDQELLASLKRGEEDIKAGHCTLCKTDQEITTFFSSI